MLTYRRADGTLVRELRHPDQVFAADSLASLRDAPVTIGHPGNGQTWVDPQNAAELEVGVVHDAAPEHEFVRSRLTIRRADAIKRVDAKELLEVSCGYDAAIDPTPGTYEGQAYDQQQVDIRYNHLALLPPGQGRCGSDVRLRADSADAVVIEPDAQLSATSTQASTLLMVTPSSATSGQLYLGQAGTSVAPLNSWHIGPAQVGAGQLDLVAIQQMISRAQDARRADEGDRMTTRRVRVDGVDHELPETAAGLIDKLIGERDGEKKRADKAEGERDVMRGQLDTAQAPENLSQLVRARVDLERGASSVLGAEQRFDSLSDRQVREKVLSVVSPSFKIEGRSDDAISAAFDYAMSTAGKVNRGLQLVNEALSQTSATQQQSTAEQPRTDGAPTDLWAQFDELEQKRANAWRGKAS